VKICIIKNTSGIFNNSFHSAATAWTPTFAIRRAANIAIFYSLSFLSVVSSSRVLTWLTLANSLLIHVSREPIERINRPYPLQTQLQTSNLNNIWAIIRRVCLFFFL